MEPAITTEPKSWEPFYFISFHFILFLLRYIELISRTVLTPSHKTERVSDFVYVRQKVVRSVGKWPIVIFEVLV